MMNELLEELKRKDIAIRFCKGKLQYSGPEQFIDEALLAKLKEHKQSLLKHFWPLECPNILPVNTNGNSIPLVLLHGGTFFQLSEYIGPHRPLYSFYYIGSEFEGKRFDFHTVEEFAGEYLKQLQFVVPHGPYFLAGISMGGHLAYEMAIQLQNQGQHVPFLVLVDSGLYAYDRPSYPKQIAKKVFHWSFRVAKNVRHYCLQHLREWKYNWYFLSDKRLPENKRTRYVLFKYDTLIEKYRPTQEFKGEILLFRASDNLLNSEYLGWDKVCKRITVVNYQGNHASMFNDINTIELIKGHIAEWLDRFDKN